MTVRVIHATPSDRTSRIGLFGECKTNDHCVFCGLKVLSFESCVVGSVAYVESGKGIWNGYTRCDVVTLADVHGT